MEGEWWYDWYDEGGGGFRWLLARNGVTQALSSPVYATRLDAVQAAEDFSRSISHITFSVAPVDAWFWSWIATFRGALLAGSGAYPSVETAQEAAVEVEAHARMAPTVAVEALNACRGGGLTGSRATSLGRWR